MFERLRKNLHEKNYAPAVNAIDLIPGLVQHHAFTQKVIRASREDALNIIDQIDSLTEDFDR